MLARKDPSGEVFQPGIASILLQQTTNGVFLAFSIVRDSTVWGSTPFVTSMTRIATSAADPPLLRRLLKVLCPGVSIKRMPGTSILRLNRPSKGPHILLMV